MGLALVGAEEAMATNRQSALQVSGYSQEELRD
ncbi:hypothetical protein ACLK1S_12870 [Escherichia coli]